MIGEKVVDPLIHCCEKCSLPILIYGRMVGMPSLIEWPFVRKWSLCLNYLSALWFFFYLDQNFNKILFFQIPCKHVFCFNCAKKTDKNCPRYV